MDAWRKDWEELVNQAEWYKELAKNDDNIPRAQKTILAMDAAYKEMEAQLCRAREAMEKWIPGITQGMFGDPSPCRHEVEAKRLREAGEGK